MDITKYNFEEQLESIKNSIEESTFLAIDGEFTGLTAESSASYGSFDTPAERYKKIRDGASDFLLIQFGLCAFKAIEEEKRYEAKPYNFYIFPRPHNQQAPDRRFLCQSSSIDFLISHDFDFNKLFKEGIPYLTYDQMMKMTTDLERRQTERKLNSSLLSPENKSFVVPKEQEEFISNIRKKVDEYLKSEDTDPIQIPPCNNFQRKIIYKTMEQNYPLIHVETRTGEKKERYMVLSKCGDEKEMKDKEQTKNNMERMALDLQIGFTKVIKMISESGKLVVGHNMYLDVLHSVRDFYGPAPQELDDFKEMIGTIFPRLLDTKLMASTSPFKDYFMGTSLEEVIFTTKHPPFKQSQVDLSDGFTKYSEDGTSFHEAGYDAFVTGSCFASMVNFLGRYQNPAKNFVLPSSPSVQPFVNKLFMMRILDIPYVNLAGPDDEPVRDHVFHVTFPAEWRSDDLYMLFEPYGNIHISWLTSTTAYVSLHKKGNTNLVLTGLCRGPSPFQVITYNSHRQMLAQAKASTMTDCYRLDSNNTSTIGTTATNGNKKRSSPTDTSQLPAKHPRKSLVKEAVPHSSIPEESEEMQEENSEEEGGQLLENEMDEEDLGVSVSELEIKKIERKKGKKTKTKSKDLKETLPNDCDSKMFEEPDMW